VELLRGSLCGLRVLFWTGSSFIDSFEIKIVFILNKKKVIVTLNVMKIKV